MAKQTNRALEGAVLPTFFYYAIPSLLGLLAISTAGIVDGIFIGRFLGSSALAAVNLLIPYFTFMFALALMIAIGGSVLAGKYLGENKHVFAHRIFSQSLLTIISITTLAALLIHWFPTVLFHFLGAPLALHQDMSHYLNIMSLCLIIQLTGMVLYYFIRVDGQPVLGTIALMVGAGTNIALDALFLGYFKLDISWAAWATTLAQTLQCVIMLLFFTRPERRLQLTTKLLSAPRFLRALYNGSSEFINELSVGIVIFTVHWLLLRNVGAQGVAGFAIANYLLFIGMMTFYGIIDAVHVLISQNHGAKNKHRIRQIMAVATTTIMMISALLAMAAWSAPQFITALFLDDITSTASLQAQAYMQVIWPCFLFSGMNVLLSSYFTATQQPRQSATIALLRGLILPVGLLLGFSFAAPWHFLIALPVAEGLTLLFALNCYRIHSRTQHYTTNYAN
ncbi:multidrug transporter MatE [Photobacterium jeanii]|uniref:Multidrug resistance protein NorM n=1 Tax=Photobacterium jeanii TaxID=858640 RepID=A0A178KAH1_9GAMM|nr:MATE family efflux transporter [Photobacterium jeanii]OAN14056.1 multidrug transporter MatE [Photobacterium jeanii]PST86930.1 multidrug transporter MatE [Photobacterium jeanii]